MTQTTVYELGVPASCTDGFCGNVTHFVVESPPTPVVTHLIVEPELHSRVGKLVPIRLVEAADDSVEIECDLADFDALADADENMSNTLPSGHLAVRGDQHVHSTDGEIGKIRAVTVEAGSHRATHILLQEGHLWGKREVAIPWDSVTSLDGGVHLSLTSEEIKELPAVPSEASDGLMGAPVGLPVSALALIGLTIVRPDTIWPSPVYTDPGKEPADVPHQPHDRTWDHDQGQSSVGGRHRHVHRFG